MKSSDFDWSLARSLVAVIDQGSLLAAARALRVSQPTVGRHIAELERQLGVVLFERSNRGFRPTATALRLVEAARTMAEEADKLSSLAKTQDRSLSGSVRLTAAQPIACVLLPPILRAMQEALPEVTVELVVSNAVNNLLKREADIALRMVRPQQATLVSRRLCQVPLHACAHEDYLRRRGVPEKPHDLRRHDIVGSDRSMELERGSSMAGYPSPQLRLVMRSDDLMAQWASIRAGLGVGFAAGYVIRSDPAVKVLLPTLNIPSLPLWLVVHREIHTTPRIRAVFDFMAKAIPKAVAG